MDAQDLSTKVSPRHRRVERITAFVLALMCAAGLWQGYGEWLFGAHVR